MAHGGTLHVISPTSVAGWFAAFSRLTEADSVLDLGWRGGESVEQVLCRLRREVCDGNFESVVFHSSHETMMCDAQLATQLRRLGVPAFAQSRRAARVGEDKIRMKHVFDRVGVDTPAWSPDGRNWRRAGAVISPKALRGILVKSRFGTAGAGMSLASEKVIAVGVSKEQLAEEYIQGTEYSVAVFRDGVRWVTFPSVWKGDTSTSLLPPYRRIRLCPAFVRDCSLDLTLRETAVALAKAVACRGLMEVEYVISRDGQLLVLEVNPRLSGTMRMTALAVRCPIFALPSLRHLRGHLTAVQVALEVPYRGPAFCLPDVQLFATTRLTSAAGTIQEAIAKVMRTEGATVPTAHFDELFARSGYCRDARSGVVGKCDACERFSGSA